jgi:acetoacetyl-CoA synthetase
MLELRGEGLQFNNYSELWSWSTTHLEGFWESVWQFNEIISSQDYKRVLSSVKMPGAKWFEGARLNYAEHVFRNHSTDRPALVAKREATEADEITWNELRTKTGALAWALAKAGIRRGDRVAAYLSNVPEAVIGLLACASIGAVWSSCSPDFGAPSVIERFKQIEPAILLANDGYDYDGKYYDRLGPLSVIQSALPSLKKTVIIPARSSNQRRVGNSVFWDEFLETNSNLSFDRVPFDHPLWVVYSSGTTGLPKPIVHGHGGILLEHLKILSLHNDIKPGDRFFWFTTTGWMMWNYLVSGLLLGATIVLYDGSPGRPDMNSLWELAEETRMTYLGASAAYVSSCMKTEIRPGDTFDLRALKGFGSTGSPLTEGGFRWIYRFAKRDIWLASISGGTDVATAFVGGCPILPVFAGEIQCRCLGAKVESFDENGRSTLNNVGELVVTAPMPSMPLYFWGDKDGKRYRESYFETFPAVWRHGDWIEITDRGSCIIYGRSDATLKRMGVRIGTSEIYRIVESIPEVVDSLVIDLEGLGGRSYMPLFIVTKKGTPLDKKLSEEIKLRIRNDLSPRYIPDRIFQVSALPRTLNGKKLEVPVRKIFLGMDPSKALNRDSVDNLDALENLILIAKQIREDIKK